MSYADLVTLLLAGFYVGAGFNAFGIASGGGAGWWRSLTAKSESELSPSWKRQLKVGTLLSSGPLNAVTS